MCAMNHRAEKMQFALLKIKMQFVNVHLDIRAIQYQMLVANWLMHAHIALNHLYVKSHQLDIYANVHKVTLGIPKRLDVSQLVNVQMVT